jgi:hypothetical protein
MTTKIKNLSYNFSDVENDLIESYTNLHKGEITRTRCNGFEFFLMKSEGVNASFRVNKTTEGKRFLYSCVKGLNLEYHSNFCSNPMELQKHLGL